MAFDETLAARIRVILTRKKNIAEKKMFGGICFLLNAHLLVGVWKQSLIVRLGPDQEREVIQQPYLRRMDITGKPMKGWIIIEPAGLEGDDVLKQWIDRALKFVGKLPAKQR
jgi:hypothetical protein